MRFSDSRGFSLIELMMVIAIAGLLAAVAMPNYIGYRNRSITAACQANRHHIDFEEKEFFSSTNTANLAIKPIYKCPGGGIYLWLVSDPESPSYPRAGCSLHYAAIPADAASGGDDSPPPFTLSSIDGYVSGFSMDEGGGTSLSGDDNTANIYGAEWVEGKSGSALRFNGTSDLAVADIPDQTGPFSVMMWVNPDEGNVRYDAAFSSTTKGPNKNNFQIDSDGKDNFRFLSGTTLDMGAMTPGEWQLLAVTYDGDTVQTYNNGELVDSGKCNNCGNITHYALGRNRAGGNRFGGAIDELGVFDQAITADNISSYYEGTK